MENLFVADPAAFQHQAFQSFQMRQFLKAVVEIHGISQIDFSDGESALRGDRATMQRSKPSQPIDGAPLGLGQRWNRGFLVGSLFRLILCRNLLERFKIEWTAGGPIERIAFLGQSGRCAKERQQDPGTPNGFETTSNDQ
jgi:hypothetical protein